jgi:Transposase IS66 family
VAKPREAAPPTLTRFITNVEIPPDNNRSERSLRVVALGRKNFLFAGDKEAGEHLAALYTCVFRCIRSAVPEASDQDSGDPIRNRSEATRTGAGQTVG